jgi:2-iminoacetate synthase ThiH
MTGDHGTAEGTRTRMRQEDTTTCHTAASLTAVRRALRARDGLSLYLAGAGVLLAAWATIAMARLVLGSKMRLQAPPNLVGSEFGLMLRAGIDDWGAVSPVTIDHVSPERPWPALDELTAQWRRAEQRDGMAARRTMAAAAPARLDADARAGLHLASTDPAALLDPAHEWAAMAVLTAEGTGLKESCRLADELRAIVGDEVSYVVNHNINFSNVYYAGCRLCAFAQPERDTDAFRLSLDEVAVGTVQAAQAAGSSHLARHRQG